MFRIFIESSLGGYNIKIYNTLIINFKYYVLVLFKRLDVLINKRNVMFWLI